MPEYSSTTITPADGVQLPAQNGATSGNFTLSALRSFILASKGQANGLAGLGSDGKLDPSQVPGNLDDVLVYSTSSNFPETGTAGKIYIAADTNRPYRWDDALATPDYVELSVDLSDYATKAEVADAVEDLEAADTDLKNALQASEQRIENLEQAVSGSLVQTNVLTDPPSMANVRTITNANAILPWALLNRVGARATGWNQLANVGATVFGTKVNSFTFNANFSARNQTYQQTTDTIKTVSGHKYLLRIKSDGSPNLRTAVNGIIPFIGELTISQGYETILTGDGSDSYFNFTQSDVSLGGNGNIYINFFDLTAMNEYDSTLTDAQNIASFRAKYPASYYPYNAGQIIPLNPSGFKVVEKQKWDEVTEDGYIGSDGSLIGGSEHKRSKNFSPCQPSTSYYITIPSSWTSATPTLCWYDIDKNFIMRSDFLQFPVYTAPANAYYFKITLFNYGTTYRYDVMVCLNSVTDKTYESYSETTLDTSFTSDYKYVNESCHDYSENVLVDGQKKRKEHPIVGTYVFTGNEAWEDLGNCMSTSVLVGTIKPSASASALSNVMIETVPTEVQNDIYSGSVTNGICVATNGTIRIGTATYTNRATLLTGKTLRYEKASVTPTLHNDPIPNFPCEDGTTITAITPQTELVNAIDVPTTIAYMTKIAS